MDHDKTDGLLVPLKALFLSRFYNPKPTVKDGFLSLNWPELEATLKHAGRSDPNVTYGAMAKMLVTAIASEINFTGDDYLAHGEDIKLMLTALDDLKDEIGHLEMVSKADQYISNCSLYLRKTSIETDVDYFQNPDRLIALRWEALKFAEDMTAFKVQVPHRKNNNSSLDMHSQSQKRLQLFPSIHVSKNQTESVNFAQTRCEDGIYMILESDKNLTDRSIFVIALKQHNDLTILRSKTCPVTRKIPAYFDLANSIEGMNLGICAISPHTHINKQAQDNHRSNSSELDRVRRLTDLPADNAVWLLTLLSVIEENIQKAAYHNAPNGILISPRKITEDKNLFGGIISTFFWDEYVGLGYPDGALDLAKKFLTIDMVLPEIATQDYVALSQINASLRDTSHANITNEPYLISAGSQVFGSEDDLINLATSIGHANIRVAINCKLTEIMAPVVEGARHWLEDKIANVSRTTLFKNLQSSFVKADHSLYSVLHRIEDQIDDTDPSRSKDWIISVESNVCNGASGNAVSQNQKNACSISNSNARFYCLFKPRDAYDIAAFLNIEFDALPDLIRDWSAPNPSITQNEIPDETVRPDIFCGKTPAFRINLSGRMANKIKQEKATLDVSDNRSHHKPFSEKPVFRFDSFWDS